MKIKRNTKSIYVIENLDNGRVKIGVSDNPEHRIKILMCQSGCQMVLRYKSHQIDNHFEVEKNLHSMFIDKRFVGEWFNLSVKESITAVKRMVKDRHDCAIIRKFEEGLSIYNIALETKVSRTAIVNYLKKKGYRPKDRKGNEIKVVKYIPAQPHKETSSIVKSKLELMVEENNRKIALKRSRKLKQNTKK